MQPPPPLHYTNNHSLLLNERSQKDPDDSRTTPWEQQPCTHSAVVCVIDPSNGDNGCYSHTWEDQRLRKEPSAPAVHAPDWAALIHYTFLAGERLDQSTFFRKVKGGRGGELLPDIDWKYARLESTAILPKAHAGSWRKGMKITPSTTDQSANGLRLWNLDMKTITGAVLTRGVYQRIPQLI